MKLSKEHLWQRFQKYYSEYPSIGLALDLSRMDFADDFFERLEPRLQAAFEEMKALEAGAIANPDENRMVGHYWLRNSALAPTPAIRQEIEETIAAIKQFAVQVHGGAVRGHNGVFRNLLVIGIGGSALGPQFVTKALGHPATDKLRAFFFDNTDPDGMDRVLAEIGDELGQTLTVVISKSGGTKETRNGMLEARVAYERAGLNFTQHAIAVTGKGSELDLVASNNSWIQRFPMWDWVGGRTSELSAVGLLPAALQGFDIDAMLRGAEVCDEITRGTVTAKNPAAGLAAAWFHAGTGNGLKNMVVLPYKDRLELFSRYLQQLVMESLGKELDRAGKIVNQGLAVYGNKGSTDQHAYVQQLRDGLDNFFVTFIEVLRDRRDESLAVEVGITSGDYLSGFLLGTREALYENGRESITLTIHELSPATVGALIALFERTVGIYAALINVNAYHQPGVEAGKKAATKIISLQNRVLSHLAESHQRLTPAQLANALNAQEDVEMIFKICEHLAANPDRRVRKQSGATPFQASYRF
ncbi:MAG TPA: glucose-6-phosphate isomerase [Candidatus Limnocylindria bacterium]|nr:glucose-6-phosphate isomerase [Candidatus Limnocylindria bacterium]